MLMMSTIPIKGIICSSLAGGIGAGIGMLLLISYMQKRA